MYRADSNYGDDYDNHDDDDEVENDCEDENNDDGAPCNKFYCCLNLWV